VSIIDPDPQGSVNTHFNAAALYWQAVYDDPRLQGVIYRARQRAVLGRLDELRLPSGSPVLEIGCGAGLLTSELARRGFAVRAVDASEAMVELTARRIEREDFTANVRAEVADVHALPFASGEFALVIAVGVLPWLHMPAGALEEMARVLHSHGRLILTADNRARLNTLVDPRASLLLAPIKRLRQRKRQRSAQDTCSRLHFPSHVNALVRAAGFHIEQNATVGFGPFSFWSRPLLTDQAGVALHKRLQPLADRDVPILRSTGWHYLLSAQRN
jgi:ubiquinone/menaquinone biosynthesis C-methylase UbiE